LIFRKVGLTLKSTASKIEHKKDKVMVSVAYRISKFKVYFKIYNKYKNKYSI